MSSILTGGSNDAGVKKTKKILVDNLYPFFTYKIGCPGVHQKLACNLYNQ